MYDWSIVGHTVHTVSNVHLLLRMTTGYIMQKVAFSTCLRLLPNFVGVLPEKICTRASFTTILANYISEEYSILGCFWRFQNFFSMETLSWTFEFSYVKQKKNFFFWASEDGKFVNNGGTVVLLLLDLSAAFDTVDHSILLDRLKMRFGIKGRVLAWFKTNLAGRSQFVCLNRTSSRRSDLMYAVPQGSVLCPILYLLYTSPLSEVLRRHNMNFHFYADDSQVYFSFDSNSSVIVARIEACLHDIATWMSLNKLKLNGNKTELLVIGS